MAKDFIAIQLLNADFIHGIKMGKVDKVDKVDKVKKVKKVGKVDKVDQGGKV